ncbi:MAG TPA: hypothetical protein VLV89_12000 [Candidatus Acidoferrum sp.]|nr:hypothetical protein [Candidatus Acidoferrum sp.]
MTIWRELPDAADSMESLTKIVRRPALGAALAGWALAACALAAGPALAGSPPAAPTVFHAEASQAFNRYIQLTEERIAQEIRPGGAFLTMDRLPADARIAAYTALRGGELRMERVETKDNGQAIDCPGGIIHHWVGVVFIPGATMEMTMRMIQDYDHQADVYAPQVVRSKTISHAGDDFHIYMRLREKEVITVVLDTEHDAHFDRLDPQRIASSSVSTRVQQVEDAGEPNEHDLPAGQDSGYLWRINSYWRFLERDGGVYMQCESVSLTRNIPTGLGWIIRPLIESIPRDLLRATLDHTRRGLARARAVTGANATNVASGG